jgi:uncharacterized RDD family membrane protein YckC
LPNQKPTAVAGQRFVAFLIDTLIISVFIAIIWLLLVDKLPKDQVIGDAGFDIGDKRYAFTEANSYKQTIWLLLSGLAAFVVSVVVPAFSGSSPGRAVAGIRVVNEQGGPPGFGKSLVRWLLWIIDGFFFWAVGGILVLANGKNQRLGDMAAKTFTVKKENAGRPVEFPQIGGGYGQPGGGYGQPGGGYAQPGYGGYQPQPQAPQAQPQAAQAQGAGWHPDPRGQARLRYWDGSQWTEHTSA